MLKTRAYRTLSGGLDEKFGGVMARLVISDPIREQVCWTGKRTVFYWRLYPVGGKK